MAHIVESDLQQARVEVQRVLGTDSALVGISEAVSSTTEMTTQIAAATGEQNTVAEEINRNISTIAALTEQIPDEVLCTVKLSEKLTTTAQS